MSGDLNPTEMRFVEVIKALSQDGNAAKTAAAEQVAAHLAGIYRELASIRRAMPTGPEKIERLCMRMAEYVGVASTLRKELSDFTSALDRRVAVALDAQQDFIRSKMEDVIVALTTQKPQEAKTVDS